MLNGEGVGVITAYSHQAFLALHPQHLQHKLSLVYSKSQLINLHSVSFPTDVIGLNSSSGVEISAFLEAPVSVRMLFSQKKS